MQHWLITIANWNDMLLSASNVASVVDMQEIINKPPVYKVVAEIAHDYG